jgi:hypothetical protein
MKYQTLDRKITHLRKTQNLHPQPDKNGTTAPDFYPRVTNLTNIPFSNKTPVVRLLLCFDGINFQIVLTNTQRDGNSQNEYQAPNTQS